MTDGKIRSGSSDCGYVRDVVESKAPEQHARTGRGSLLPPRDGRG
jgi:hypothetical protein